VARINVTQFASLDIALQLNKKTVPATQEHTV
jgi:hypothetical protein